MPGICPRCLGEVYFAEEKLALGKVWHIFCFSCRNCRKLLDSCTVATHSGDLFCRNCYNRLFSTTSVRPTLPSPRRPILPTVDNTRFVDSPCESLFDCCCCCNCEKKCEFNEANGQEEIAVEGSSNCESDKRRLRAGDGADGGVEEVLEVAGSFELGDNVIRSKTDLSQLDLRSSQTTVCEQSANPIAVTAWYNRHHSASQSTFSRPSSAQQAPLRPSSTPASGEVVGVRDPCNLSCSGQRRPGSPCRPNYKNREHSKKCHRQHCREFHRSERVLDLHEESKIVRDCRGRSFVQNYCNNLRKTSYPPLPPDHTPPPSIRRSLIQSPRSYLSASSKLRRSTMQNIVDDEDGHVDIISFEHSGHRDDGNEDDGNIGNTDRNLDDDGELEDGDDRDEDARMRGGCGGGGGSGCCCSGGIRNPCGRMYQKDRSSTIEGACGCSGYAKSGCGSGVTAGGCCGGATPANTSMRAGGCCSTTYDDCNQGACASKPIRHPGCYEVCPPRSPDPCSTDPSSLSPCGAGACSPPCSGRKGCCPPSGCRPVRRRIARCNTPCIGDSQSCGGGGCCGSGCRGGCGKPGQTCLPLRPCTIPPCMPHPQGGGSPCMPSRGRSPNPPCCRVPVIPGTLGTSGTGGGSGCCRSGSPGNRSGGGGGCAPSPNCQQQEDTSPYDPCCQTKLPNGCECLGGGQDCQRCGRKVYQAEMQIASGVPYHNICFSCFCCRKPLETLTYHENCGEIYCKQCYVRNFGPQGYGYSGVLQTPM